jgi:hypothetical protein
MYKHLLIFPVVVAATSGATNAEIPRCYWNDAMDTVQCTEARWYSDNTDPYGGYDPGSQEGQRFFWDNLAR